MELKGKLKEQVMDAIAEAIKGLRPKPAVDRVLTARVSGKWGHYVQVLLTYSPDTYGLAYCNVNKPSEIKVKIHDAESRGGKAISGKEIKRLKRQEKAVERKAAKEVKAKAAEPSKAPKTKAPKATKPEVAQ